MDHRGITKKQIPSIKQPVIATKPKSELKKSDTSEKSTNELTRSTTFLFYST